MRIAMFTNTYLPHVGGVARAVSTLEEACRRAGHRVCVVAPEFADAPGAPGVLRVPAIQNFNGSDFSVRLPFAEQVPDFIADFRPDIIHSHHPFLLGDTALREAWKLRIPVVFTHHTLYERYTHYVPLDSPALKRAAIQLTTEYSNLCHQVIAPSESIARLLAERGVTSPVQVIPTGIDTAFFASGDGPAFRRKHGIPDTARVIGHTGRLAHEKNLAFTARTATLCLQDHSDQFFLLIGDGDAREDVLDIFEKSGTASRLIAPGRQTGQDLADAYAAMDCFLFASQTETQGLVLAEAMAAGLPVAALDGPGVREIVEDRRNGRLLPATASARELASATSGLLGDPDTFQRLSLQALHDSAAWDTSRRSAEMIACYADLTTRHLAPGRSDPSAWDRFLNSLEIEWSLFLEKMSAAAAAVTGSSLPGAEP